MAPTSHIQHLSASAIPFDGAVRRPFGRLARAVGPIAYAAATLGRTTRVEGTTALARLGHQWNALGERDALGAVLTRPGLAPGWDVHDFFETGRADVDRLMTSIADRAPGLTTRRALDFGCGVGRLTQALTAHFSEVCGVDVADSMIARAREENGAPQRCYFLVNRRPHLRRFGTGTFDLVYSRLVLQHVPPQLVRRYIPELVRVLAPGGLLVFQLPTVISDPLRSFHQAPVRGRLKRALPRCVVRGYRTLKYPLFRPPASAMDMFGMARETVVWLVDQAGGHIVATLPDESHGTSQPGFEYWVARAPRA
jgi:SAM-dependent methyltransferase